MIAFAILAAFPGLLGPFLLISFFVSLGRARIRFRFLISAILMIIAILPIMSNFNFFVHISIISTTAPSPRSGWWRGGGEHRYQPHCYQVVHHQVVNHHDHDHPAMNKIDCRSSDRGESVKEFSSSSKSWKSLKRISQNITSITEARKYVGLITESDECSRK